MSKRSQTTRILVESAILVALASVLSLITPFELPFGGSITPASMLPILLNGIKNGPKWGMGSAVVFSVIQLMFSLGKVMSWGLSVPVLLICIFFDYIFAYSLLGIAGLFQGKSRSMCIFGACLAVFLRFICHFITGITIWANWADGFKEVMLYSLTYNGSYMFPELILTFVLMVVLVNVPQVRKILGIQAEKKAA